MLSTCTHSTVKACAGILHSTGLSQWHNLRFPSSSPPTGRSENLLVTPTEFISTCLSFSLFFSRFLSLSLSVFDREIFVTISKKTETSSCENIPALCSSCVIFSAESQSRNGTSPREEKHSRERNIDLSRLSQEKRRWTRHSWFSSRQRSLCAAWIVASLHFSSKKLTIAMISVGKKCPFHYCTTASVQYIWVITLHLSLISFNYSGSFIVIKICFPRDLKTRNILKNTSKKTTLYAKN